MIEISSKFKLYIHLQNEGWRTQEYWFEHQNWWNLHLKRVNSTKWRLKQPSYQLGIFHTCKNGTWTKTSGMSQNHQPHSTASIARTPVTCQKRTHWPENYHHFPQKKHSPKSRGYEPQKPMINTWFSRTPTTYSHVFPGFFPCFPHVSPPFLAHHPQLHVSAACATKKAMKAQHAAASQEGCEARLCKIATFMAWFWSMMKGLQGWKKNGCFTMVLPWVISHVPIFHITQPLGITRY